MPRVKMPGAMISALLLTLVLGACGSAKAPGASSSRIPVIAAENFWASLVTQLGGDRVDVTSIVSDPNADPHEYQASSADARAFSDASYVIVNGAGYDAWAQHLLDANPSGTRRVTSVADLLGKRAGDNPHFWYSPAYVERVADRITADLSSVDSGGAAYYRQQRINFEMALSDYHALITDIRDRFLNERILATEDIFVYLADALGLDLVSPPEFMRAVAEGNDPPAASVAQLENEIEGHAVAVLVLNRQTVTPLTTSIERLARQNGLAVVPVTETIVPDGLSYQDWQAAQLRALESALGSHPVIRS